MKTIRRFILIALVAGAVGFSNRASAQEHTLRAVYNAISGVMSPIWVAADAGLFTKHGVNVDMNT